MSIKSEKISVRQAMLILLVLTYSPCMRLIPFYTAQKANQAAWLSPIISFLCILVLVLMINSFYKNYQTKEVSFSDIICDVLGRFSGKLLIFMYIIFLIFLTAFYTRFLGERLVGTLFTGTDTRFFIIIVLVFVSFLLNKGLVVIARMSEIVFFILLIAFISISFFLIPNIDIKNLTPISYLDIFPVARASVGVTEIWSYYTLIFFFTDRISNFKKIKKTGLQIAFFSLAIMIVLITTCIGVLGSEIVKLSTFPYIQTVQMISIFGVIERVESVINLIWTASDFILIGVFSYITLHLIKFLFNIKNIVPFKNIFLVLTFVISSAFVTHEFKLLDFSVIVLTPAIMFFCYGVPIILFVVGKVRGKI